MKRSLCVLALVLLAGCGPATDSASPGSTTTQLPTAPGTYATEATAVEVLPRGAGFAITVNVPAGDSGCGGRARARYDGLVYGAHYVTTTVRTPGGVCPDRASRVVELRVPVRGRDLVLNTEGWEPGPGRSYVRCSTAVGCHPPRDKCDDVWTRTVARDVEIPPEQRISTVACEVPWLVVDVDAVVTGCQSVDGSTPPPGCDGSGVHTRWFAHLDPDLGWQVVASGTAAGCDDVDGVPEFPRRLCEQLPAR